ncbi:MAG: ATP synthase F1 subunit delta [Actinobacteria bacterium]|nr:MAG: ATP synthase F1 subunit delta [Actinomycetota bacterium]
MAEKRSLVRGYAQALFAVAEAEGQLEQVEDELFRFGKAVETESELREALTDPALPVDRKKAVVQELLGGRASGHTVNLVEFLLEQGRAKDLARIVDAMTELAAERRRRAVADRLATALSEATGKDVELRTLVDPSVIGGVVARVGDVVFDGSVKRKLEMAREQLAGTR